jgi:hypothetical protein
VHNRVLNRKNAIRYSHLQQTLNLTGDKSCAEPRVITRHFRAVHAYTVPALPAVFTHLAGNSGGLLLALIWIAHIRLDRMLGFRLKYPSRFEDTYLSRERDRSNSVGVAG